VLDRGRVVAEGTADELKARVGSETIALTFADEDALLEAAREVGGHVDVERLTLRVPGDGSAAGVRELLDRLEQHGIAVERLDLHRPTLDEVFLTLTERTLEMI